MPSLDSHPERASGEMKDMNTYFASVHPGVLPDSTMFNEEVHALENLTRQASSECLVALQLLGE